MCYLCLRTPVTYLSSLYILKEGPGEVNTLNNRSPHHPTK